MSGEKKIYSIPKELQIAVCDAITDGLDLHSIGSMKHMPSFSTIMRALREDREFAQMFEIALRAGAIANATKMLAVAEGRHREGQQDSPVAIARDKLVTDVLKWQAETLGGPLFNRKLANTGDEDELKKEQARVAGELARRRREALAQARAIDVDASEASEEGRSTKDEENPADGDPTSPGAGE